ncbi:hypothetical protein ACWD5V_14810 [Streptomyces sp. NPDC002523]
MRGCRPRPKRAERAHVWELGCAQSHAAEKHTTSLVLGTRGRSGGEAGDRFTDFSDTNDHLADDVAARLTSAQANDVLTNECQSSFGNPIPKYLAKAVQTRGGHGPDVGLHLDWSRPELNVYAFCA